MKTPVFEAACCPPVLSGPVLSREDAEALAAALKVVAEPARLQILNLVQAADEACVCHLTGPLGLSQPTVSHHLKVLREAGLLSRERRGSWVYYRVCPDRIATLRGALT